MYSRAYCSKKMISLFLGDALSCSFDAININIIHQNYIER